MKECCSPWLVVSTGRCHLVRPLVRLNLFSLSFLISDLPPSVGRILSSSFSSVLWHFFLRPSFVCRRLSAPSLATAEHSLSVDMRECQDGGLHRFRRKRVLKKTFFEEPSSKNVTKMNCNSAKT